MARLKIQLFGEFRVWRGEELIGGNEWGRQKTRSLLKLLLTRPGHVFSRDVILEALWPDAPPKGADHSLRTTVGLLRKALEPDLKRGPDSKFIIQRRPGYLFDHNSDCEIDASEFEERRKEAESLQKAERLDAAIDEYREALRLVGGEFLAEDLYEEWAMEAREEWRDRHLAALSNLSECLALRGNYTGAIEAITRALSLDGHGEELHRRLMLYHYCAGEQALALRAYRRYAKTLKEELGAAPSPDLARLKDQIEARDVPGVDTARRYPKPRRPLRFNYSLGRTRFVGRDLEFSLLAGRLEEAMEGYGNTVAVEGEAGVGKTRLVEEFLGYAGERGVSVLSGRCYERELGPPLEPIMDALERTDDLEEYGHPDETGPNSYHALAGKLIRESGAAKLLFVDDIQWADPATLEFLSYLAKRVSGKRALLITSHRREDAAALSGWLDHLAERRAVEILSLDRLSLEETTGILESMSSRSFRELRKLARFIHDESEGNPFYVVEYLRWMIEAGAVEVNARGKALAVASETAPFKDTDGAFVALDDAS